MFLDVGVEVYMICLGCMRMQRSYSFIVRVALCDRHSFMTSFILLWLLDAQLVLWLLNAQLLSSLCRIYKNSVRVALLFVLSGMLSGDIADTPFCITLA